MGFFQKRLETFVKYRYDKIIMEHRMTFYQQKWGGRKKHSEFRTVFGAIAGLPQGAKVGAAPPELGLPALCQKFRTRIKRKIKVRKTSSILD
jgi:hypothetical protein